MRNVITGIPGIKVEEGLQEKVKNLVLSSVDPVPTFRLKVVPLSTVERCVLLVEVPESTDPPHFTKDGRVYVRTPTGSDPVPETDRYVVEKLFLKAEHNRQIVQESIETRFAAAPRIPDGSWGFTVVVCPRGLAASSLSSLFTREGFERWRTLAASPLQPGDLSYHITQEGVLAFRGDDEFRQELVAVYGDGALSYFRQRKLEAQGGAVVEGMIREAIESVMSLANQALAEMEYFGTLSLGLTVSNVKGARLRMEGHRPDDPTWLMRQIRVPPAQLAQFRIDREMSAIELQDSQRRSQIASGVIRELRRCFHLQAFEDDQ